MLNRTGLAMVLWVLVIGTAFAIVRSSYHYRVAFIEWQSLLEQEQAYQVEWGQLLLEKSTLASYLGLENLAREGLNMGFPARQQIVIVEEPAQ